MVDVRSIWFSLLLAAPISAQAVWVVDKNNGPGTDFTNIAPAVAAALDGDLVLVRPGSYAEVLQLDGKGLVVQADGNPLASAEVRGIEVRNLASGQFAAVRGLTRNRFYGPIVLEQNLGRVWLEESNSPPSLFAIFHGTIVDCAAVELRDMAFDVYDTSFGYYETVTISRSNVAIHGSTISGPDAGSVFEIGRPGITVGDSTLTLYDTSVSGGAGADGNLAGGPTPGGPGVYALGASRITLIASMLSGGAGGQGAADGAPIELTGTSTATTLSGSAHRMDTPSPVREGLSTSVTLTGDAGDVAYVRYSSLPGAVRALRNVVGPLVLQPPLGSVSMGTLPGSGTLALSVTVPTLPAGMLVDSLYLQPLFLGGGEIALGSPTQVHVLDSSL